MNLSQILNLTELDMVDDPFADPQANLSRSELVQLLDKLRTQAATLAQRRVVIISPIEFNNMMCDVTGETSAVVADCLGNSTQLLELGWIHISFYYVSPGVMAAPSLRWFVHGLQQMEAACEAYNKLERKIKHVERQIKLKV